MDAGYTPYLVRIARRLTAHDVGLAGHTHGIVAGVGQRCGSHAFGFVHAYDQQPQLRRNLVGDHGDDPEQCVAWTTQVPKAAECCALLAKRVDVQRLPTST